MDKVLVTGGTGFVGRWMRETQPCGLSVMYCSRREYELGFWRSREWDYIAHLAPIPPTDVLRRESRLLYCSSGIVYHPENDTEYRRAKLAGEAECLASGLDVVIARLFTFYGTWLDNDKAYTQFEKSARLNLPIKITGDGGTIRSYMHGSELGQWMWAILLKGKRGEAYDVGSDEPITMLDLARRFSDNVIVENKRPDAMPVYLPVDTDKTKRLLRHE